MSKTTAMSAAGPPQGANSSPYRGSAAATAASVGVPFDRLRRRMLKGAGALAMITCLPVRAADGELPPLVFEPK